MRILDAFTAAAAMLLLAVCACAPDAGDRPVTRSALAEPLVVETASGPVRLNVEIADDDAERAQGLMYRQHLDDDAGMLFQFQEPEYAIFWMRNTAISLDIIFIGVDGRILNIADHATPYSENDIVAAGLTSGVLEIAAGRAEALGIRPGQLVRHRIFQTE